MSMVQFTSNVTDHSNERGYQFEFHCDKCNNGYMSGFQASTMGVASGLLGAAGSFFGGIFGRAASATDQVKDTFRGKARDDAFGKAVAEGKTYFKQCSRCGKWVCPEHCWNAEKGLCESCAPNLQEEIAAAQAQIAREQALEKIKASDQLRGRDVTSEQSAAGNCPNCGAVKSGGKFCAECGKPYVTAPTQCPKCSAKVTVGAKFCPECGEKMHA